MRTLLSFLFFVSAVTYAASALTPEQETRVKELVRQTLLDNPQILAEVADKLNQQVADEQNKNIKATIEENKALLFNDANSPRIGAKKSMLTLVVFTDYNCPYCKKFDPYLEKIVKDYPDVAVVMKFLPFRSESSLTSAQLALTLWNTHPDQFMKFNYVLMSKAGYHDNASIDAAKKRAGVTITEPDAKSLETIKTSLALADKLGIQGTPATLIGDQVLSGWVEYDQFKSMVKTALDVVKH